ncbi:hypothetical protein MJD09_04195 [bacterium]|nr:hypothetical protein [bacterium]
MLKSISVAGMLLVLAMMPACAGSSSGGIATSQYLTNVGLATSGDFRQETQRILVNKHNFVVQLFEESSGRVYFETQWQDRLPFEDEKEAGVTQARSRVILEGRSRIRGGTGWQAATLKISFKGENMLLFQNQDGWQVGSPMTPRCREYFKSIANEIKTEFATQVREY